VFHQEADGITVDPTAKSVVSLGRGADCEAGGFFAVKGTQTHVVCARFPQRDVSADHLGNVDTTQKFLDE
jgi:hypothetical protein